MRILLAAALSMILPTGLLAAGGGDEKAPTKPKCEEGLVYDKKTKTCIVAEDSSLDVDTLYQTVRQLAYAERYADAKVVLAAMPQNDDRTLTYLGFTHRKQGQIDLAMAYYTRAITVNPGNILARSYMGQGLVEDGNIIAAIEQLREIRSHGGAGSWAEASLRKAIATGRTFNY